MSHRRNYGKVRHVGKPTTDAQRTEFYRAISGPKPKPPKVPKAELRAEAEKAFKDWKDKT